MVRTPLAWHVWTIDGKVRRKTGETDSAYIPFHSLPTALGEIYTLHCRLAQNVAGGYRTNTSSYAGTHIIYFLKVFRRFPVKIACQ